MQPSSLMGMPGAPGAGALSAPMMPPGAGAPAAPTGPGKLTFTPQSLEAKMHLNPSQQQQLQRIVTAGMKVMFSPQTRAMMQKIVQTPGNVAQKVATSVAGLLGILMKESGNAMPKQLLIPAGVLLIAHAAEFLDRAQMVMTDQDVGTAIQQMTTIVLAQFKMDINKVAAMGASGQVPKRGPTGLMGGGGGSPPGGQLPPGGQDPTGNVNPGPMSPMGAAGVKLGGGI